MSEKEKFIQEVYDAIWNEIQEYDYAHNSKEGLLDHLQKKSWLFDPKLCDKYFGQNTRYFGVFDTQEHVNVFIKKMQVKH